MNPPEPNDQLDALLREPEPYVEDGGFTARVIAVLPRRRRHQRLRSALLLGATTMGALLTASWMSRADLPALDSSAVTSLNAQVLLPWVPVFLAAAFLVYGAIAAVLAEE